MRDQSQIGLVSHPFQQSTRKGPMVGKGKRSVVRNISLRGVTMGGTLTHKSQITTQPTTDRNARSIRRDAKKRNEIRRSERKEPSILVDNLYE